MFYVLRIDYRIFTNIMHIKLKRNKVHISCMSTQITVNCLEMKEGHIRTSHCIDMIALTDNENEDIHRLLLLCDKWFKIDFVLPQPRFLQCIYTQMTFLRKQKYL